MNTHPLTTSSNIHSNETSSTTHRNVLLSAKGLCKQVSAPEGDDLTILNQIDLIVYQEESMAVLGASGSGKSTLLGLLAGLDIPSSGEIHLLQHSLTQLDEDERAKLRSGRVGFVFQSFQLLPGLSALENVMLPLEMAGQQGAEAKAQQLLNDVELSHRIHHYPTQLSGGEQQRVAIARAFVCEPEIVFADEPTGNLDQKTGKKITDLIFELQLKHKMTLLLVTHDPSLADRCQHRIFLEQGNIIASS